MECADRIVELYGVSKLLGDIEKGREFWRDSRGLIAEVLDWVSGPGFKEFFGRVNNFIWKDAQEYRNRFLLQALRGKAPML